MVWDSDDSPAAARHLKCEGTLLVALPPLETRQHSEMELKLHFTWQELIPVGPIRSSPGFGHAEADRKHARPGGPGNSWSKAPWRCAGATCAERGRATSAPPPRVCLTSLRLSLPCPC